MARKLHPADVADAAVIANAVRFEIALFLGRGHYAKASADTLSQALREAIRLAANHPNGRRTLIYAIDANGRSALVTNDVLAQSTGLQSKRYLAESSTPCRDRASGPQR